MAWNQRSRVTALAIALQPTPGTFVAPSAPNDLLAVSDVSGSPNAITATDNTASGTIWEGNRIILGETFTIGGSFSIRGPGGAAPPAANAWVPGRLFQSAGWSEVIKAASSAAVTVAGSTTTQLNLATTESTVDDFLLGAPIQNATIGTGFKATTLIMDYVGSTRAAILAETLGSAPATGAAYTIPAYLSYVQGTLSAAPAQLSMSYWRDKKRIDVVDWRPASFNPTVPVANENNTSFPTIAFSGNGYVYAEADDTCPSVSTAVLSVPVPGARNGKFYLDRVKLGHQSFSFTQTTTLGAASNQNAAQGQDPYDILSGTRQVSFDLNQMALTDFDVRARSSAQTVISTLTTWGGGAGNNFGIIMPHIQLDPMSYADRNGYFSMTGNAVTTDVDKAIAFTIWW